MAPEKIETIFVRSKYVAQAFVEGDSLQVCRYIQKVYKLLKLLLYEQQRQKTYIWTCAPSEDSDQPTNSCSLNRIFWIAKDAKFLHAIKEKSD